MNGDGRSVLRVVPNLVRWVVVGIAWLYFSNLLF